MPVITERHPAVVTNIEDPDQRGRIKVSCAGIMGDDETELPDFVEPSFDWGWFVIPDVGELVELEVVVSSDQDESRAQTFLEAPDIRWRQKRFYDVGADEPTAPIHPDFAAENYGKRRGFATPSGMIFVIDDEAKTLRVSWMKDPEAEDAERSSILFDEEGKIHIVHKEAHEILLEDTKLTVTLNDGNALTLEQNEADLTAKFGDGAKHPAIVEALETLYGEVKTEFDNHTHNVVDGKASSGTGAPHPPGGPVSVTIVNSPVTTDAPDQQLPDWDAGINSTKVSIPDG